MASIVTAVLTGTLGLLVKKGRKKLAEKLKDGDAAEQQLRSWIIEEFDNVNSKLDAMARSDLGASISFFKEGVVFLNKAMDFEASADTSTSAHSAKMGNEEKKMESPLKETEVPSAGVNTTSLVEEMRKLDLTNLDESGKEALFDAKKRFDDARREATKAFNNEALTPSDRILAMTVRLMATVLEKAENPANSLAACRSGLEELHLTPFVRENFKVELTRGVKAMVKMDERGQIISSVCQINRIIYDVSVIVGEKEMLFLWPCIEIGNEKIDPLRDSRVAQTLRQLDMGDCSVAWSFGLQEADACNPKIATNSLGQFLVIDSFDRCKVFDAKGTFLYSFGLPAEAEDSCSRARIIAVATDRDDNIYAVVNGYEDRKKPVSYMYVFNKQTHFSHKFLVSHEFSAKRLMGDCSVAWSFGLQEEDACNPKIATNSLGQFLVIDSFDRCKVFDAKGTFLYSFGLPAEAEDSCSRARIIAVATDRDDNIYAVVNGYEDRKKPVSYMYVFNKQTHFSHKFLVSHEFSAKRLMVKDDHLLVPGEFDPGTIVSAKRTCDFELVEYITVYKKDGTHIGYVSEQTLAGIQDVTAVDDGRIMVLNYDSCVYVFADVTTDHGVDHLYNPRASRFLRKFPVVPEARAIAFHWATGHVIIASEISETRSQVLLYSKEGNLERNIDIALEMEDWIGAAAVTTDGRICVATESKVLVM